jgi:hypothetical protein
LGILVKIFLLFIVGSVALGLFIGIIALIFAGVAWWPVNNFIWSSGSQQAYAWGTLIFFLIVPLVGFIIWLIRRITGVRSKHGYLGWTFGLLWVIGWVSMVMFAVTISRDFRHHGKIEETIAITQPPTGKMVVLVSEPELQYTGRFGWMNDENEGWDLTDDTLQISTIRFHVTKSSDDLYHVILRKESFGRNVEDAQIRAKDIRYHIAYRDSVLDLGNGYAIGKENKFRAQEVEVEIQVPVGKKINFDRSVPEKLNPEGLGFRHSERRTVVVDDHVTYYSSDDYFRFKSGVDYIMQIDGSFTDSEGNVIRNNSSYRYSDSERAMDTNEIKRSIQEKEDEIKRLKEKIKTDTSVGIRNESMDSKDEYYAENYYSPVFSLVQTFF